MPDEIFPARVKFKRRTTAQWATSNPVLLAGEPGIEVLTDGSEKIKYGDGVKTWAQLSYAAGADGGGPALSDAVPAALGATAAAGTATTASRSDHVHPRPTAGEVGADAAGTAAAAVAAHAAAVDPHPGYLTPAEGNAAYAPVAHKSSHGTGGSDAIAPGDIGAAAAIHGHGISDVSGLQTALDGKVGTGDAALSDSREWIAETISQAEAEAGVSTTRRALTAQRVFQAAAGWWLLYSSSVGRALATAIDPTAARTAIDAAVSNHGHGVFTSSANGYVPASGGGTTNFLRADGLFATPPGGTPGGSSGQVQWNNGGAFAGISNSTVDGSGNLTLGARLINLLNGAASAPPMSLTGTWFSGGTATTTKPAFLIEPAGTTSTGWSTAGTGFGVNAPSGFVGDLAWFGVNGLAQFAVKNGVISKCNQIDLAHQVNNTDIGMSLGGGSGGVYLGSNRYISWSNVNSNIFGGTRDLVLLRDAANILAQRNDTAAQTFRVYNTYTSATSYESAKLEWLGSVFRVGTEKGSAGGTARAMELQTDGITRVQISRDGIFRYIQPAPVAVNTTATLTIANLQAGIITTTTAAAVSMTLPTGTLVEGGFAVNSNDLTMEWTVINTGSNTATILAGTDHSIVGNAAVTAGASCRFATRRTAANTYVTYRLS